MVNVKLLLAVSLICVALFKSSQAYSINAAQIDAIEDGGDRWVMNLAPGMDKPDTEGGMPPPPPAGGPPPPPPPPGGPPSGPPSGPGGPPSPPEGMPKKP
ncbi:uncharacterized proline-rich protein [Tetranychus urticae]|uniref:Uncharacterized protein n=1 Tax=Tetranychus urticae TaxID=32264 RepID=T1KDJ9_TETUR|nr:uncharacterized proline-rich protein [Tetranychus urticae]